MKNQIVILLFLLAFTPAFGQFSFGVKAGAGINHIVSKELPAGTTHSLPSSLGVQIGLYSHIQMGRRFGLAPEMK